MIFGNFPRAKNIGFNKRGTGLKATNVQAAIKEMCTEFFVSKHYSLEINENSTVVTGSARANIELDGYKPIAVSSWNLWGANKANCVITAATLVGTIDITEAVVSYTNIDRSKGLSCKVDIDILYMKVA